MRRRRRDTAGDLIGGTLDMLVLRTLRAGPMHGFGIALDIEARSGDKLLVEQGSLYPALYRLEDRGWIASDWGRSDTNRRARYYRLTPAGRRQLAAEASRWTSLVEAVARVMQPAGPARGK
jgi:transcriptional regulator